MAAITSELLPPSSLAQLANVVVVVMMPMLMMMMMMVSSIYQAVKKYDRKA